MKNPEMINNIKLLLNRKETSFQSDYKLSVFSDSTVLGPQNNLEIVYSSKESNHLSFWKLLFIGKHTYSIHFFFELF